MLGLFYFFFFQAEDGIRDLTVTGVQTCALPIWVQAPRALGHALRALAKAAGGSATLFRSEAADQPGAEPDFDAQAADATAALHARLKQAFDPAGIFNRGRLAAAW